MGWEPGAWAKTLPESFIPEINKPLRELLEKSWNVPPERMDYMLARYGFGRMEIAQTQIMPWVQASIPNLKDKVVLEVGCGGGSATVPLALASREVQAFDLPGPNHHIALRRCELLEIDNVNFFQRGTEWIQEYYDDVNSLAGPVDVIFAYALLEHLTIPERLSLLEAAWRHLEVGGYLVVVETHNRLYWWDWHSGYMPFLDQLPDKLAHLWLARSDRPDVPPEIKAETPRDLERVDSEKLYRFGRGASFHEFYVAIGPTRFEVTQPYIVDRSDVKGFDLADIAALERQMALVQPKPHAAFAQPCLDLVIKKTA